MIYVFPAVFQAADEGYNVRFPDLDGMFTSGDSLEEAVELAQEMLRNTATCGARALRRNIGTEQFEKIMEEPDIRLLFKLQERSFRLLSSRNTRRLHR